MALVYRNGRPYLYKSIRRGGRVTSEYRGSGETALIIGMFDVVDTDKREEQKDIAEVERALDDLTNRSRSLAREALTVLGYHQHNRGEWRKRRA